MSDTRTLIPEDIPARPDSFGWFRKLLRPHTRPANSVTKIKTDTLENAPVPKRNKTILVVDDDPVFVKATCSRLRADGYDTAVAVDSCKAMEALRCQTPDLVVLDVNLPEDPTGMAWDGLKLMAWLNRLDAFNKIPVVMVTSGEPAKYTHLALNAGAAAFFHKQMETTQLLTLVENSLVRKTPKPPESPEANFQI